MSDKTAVDADARVRQFPPIAMPVPRRAFNPDKIVSVSEYHDRWRAETWGVRAIASFPDIDPGIMPCGSLVMCQIALPPKMIGSIHMPGETQDSIQWRTQTALVRACGPLAFHRRDNAQPWPEGPWFAPGAFVRAPMYGGDRFKMPTGQRDADGHALEVLFVTIKDLDAIAVITGDPFTIKSDW